MAKNQYRSLNNLNLDRNLNSHTSLNKIQNSNYFNLSRNNLKYKESNNIKETEDTISNNLNNEDNTCVDFLWCVNFEKWGTLEKILNGNELEITDIIPNYQGYHFAQNIASWAINYPENPVRLIYNFDYFTLVGKSYQESYMVATHMNNIMNQPKELRAQKLEELYEQYIQSKYHTDLTLDQIKEKYINAFEKFQNEISNKGYKNFQTIEFHDLCNKNLSKDQISEYPFLQDVLDHMIINAGNIVSKDFIQLTINDLGYGHEKNLYMDMDHTPKSLGESSLTFESDIKYFAADHQVLYTSHTHHEKVQNIVNSLKEKPIQSLYQTISEFNENANNKNLFIRINDELHNQEYINSHPENIFSGREIRWGGTWLKDLKNENSEPISFEKNYWPVDNDYNFMEYNAAYKASGWEGLGVAVDGYDYVIGVIE